MREPSSKICYCHPGLDPESRVWFIGWIPPRFGGMTKISEKLFLRLVPRILFLFLFFPVGVFAADIQQIFPQKNIFTSLVSSGAEIQPQELGVKEPKILPGSFWYSFVEFSRNFRIAKTLDEKKKILEKIKIAHERLYGLKIAAEKGKIKEPLIERELKKYINEMSDVQNKLEKISDLDFQETVREGLYQKEFAKQKIFDYIQWKTSQVIVQKYKEESLKKFGKFVHGGSQAKFVKTVNEYIDKNVKFDKTSFGDISFLEKLGNLIEDSAVREKLKEAGEYATMKIEKSFQKLNSKEKEKILKELVGDTSTTTQNLSVSEIIKKIQSAKEELEKKLKEGK